MPTDLGLRKTSSLRHLVSELHRVLTSGPDGGDASPVASVLMSILLARDRIDLAELEDAPLRETAFELLARSVDIIPTVLARLVFERLLTSIIGRVYVQWEPGCDHGLIMRLRDVMRTWGEDMSALVPRDYADCRNTIASYLDTVGQWLTEFGGMARRIQDEELLFEEVGERLEPSRLLPVLVEGFPKLYDHVIVQTGLDYVGSRLQALVGYHVLRHHAVSHKYSPRSRVLYAIAMTEDYFDPRWRPPSRRFPVHVLHAFEDDVTSDAVSGWISTAPANHADGLAVPVEARAYGESIRTRNPQALFAVLPECGDRRPHAAHDGSAVHATGARQVFWSFGPDVLFTKTDVKRLALDVPSILYMFRAKPALTRDQQALCSRFATELVDMLARLPERAVSNGPEAVVRILTLRGFTRRNCERYINAANEHWSGLSRSSPLGEMLGAIVYAALVGKAAHSLYARSPNTAMYIKGYTKALAVATTPHLPLLKRIGMSESDLLLPLRSFAPAPSENALHALRESLAETVDRALGVSGGRPGRGSSFGNLILYDFDTRLGTEWEKMEFVNRWNDAQPDVAAASPRAYSPIEIASRIFHTRYKSRNTADDLEILSNTVFAEFFVGAIVREVAREAARAPFTAPCLTTLLDVLAWARDYGLIADMPEVHGHRQRLLDLYRALEPFGTGTKSLEDATLEEAGLIEQALVGVFDSGSAAMSALPLEYQKAAPRIERPRRVTSRLLTGLYWRAGLNDLSDITDASELLVRDVVHTATRFINKLETVGDFFRCESSTDSVGNVTIFGSNGLPMGVWSDSRIMQNLDAVVRSVGTDIRAMETMGRSIDALRVRASEMARVYRRLVAEDGNIGPCANIAASLDVIADTHAKALDSIAAIGRMATGSGLTEVYRVMDKWRTLVAAEAAAASGLIDSVRAMIDELVVLWNDRADDVDGGHRWAGALTTRSAADREAAITSMLGPSEPVPDTDSCASSITNRYDIVSWEDTDKTLLSHPPCCDPSWNSIDVAAAIPKALVTADDILMAVDGVFAESSCTRPDTDTDDMDSE